MRTRSSSASDRQTSTVGSGRPGSPVSGEARPPSGGLARRLAWGFAVLTAVTWMLIVLGALVRAHGAGLACPDWPLCFGQWIPRFDFRVAYEWGHRLLASIVSSGLLLLSIGILRSPELRSGLRRLLVIAWGILAVQVVLGGLTVLLLLAPWTVTAHLLVGISFCVTLLWIARELFEWGRAPVPVPSSRAARIVAVGAMVLLVLQLGLGGQVSSRGAGLACLSFPTCDGSSVVPALTGLVGLQVLHRLNGFALLGALIALTWVVRDRPRAQRLVLTATRIGVLQIGVGVLNVLFRLKVEITALHTALAAALVLVLSLALREVFRSAIPRGAGVCTQASGEDASSLEAAQTA